MWQRKFYRQSALNICYVSSMSDGEYKGTRAIVHLSGLNEFQSR